jgi:hypothetical protein
MVDCGELMVACVVVKDAPRLDIFFGFRRVRRFLGVLVPIETAKTWVERFERLR